MLFLGTVAQGAEFDPKVSARATVDELVRHDFAAVEKRFDAKMAAALSVDKVKETWLNLETAAGKLKSVDEVRAQKGPMDFDVVDVDCSFEKSHWQIKVVFDPQHLVGGLGIVPGATVPATAAPEEKPLTVGDKGIKLPATLSLPKGEGPFPSVVLVHGSGPNDADETIGPNKPFRDLAWGLAARGIAVLRYEKRTHAKLIPLDSKYTVNEETVDDARAAVALLARTQRIDPKRIYVLGHSLGGLMAPRIADGNAQVAGLIILAGNTRPLEELLVEQMKRNGDPKGIAAAEATFKAVRNPKLSDGDTVDFIGVKIPARYFLDLRSYHPAQTAAALKIPMLVLQGDKDIQVLRADYDGWQKALASHGNVKLKLYPSLNHLFMPGVGSLADYAKPGHVSEEVIGDIAEFIREKQP
jgi:hypothetical protein